jgi:hypothetical protein
MWWLSYLWTRLHARYLVWSCNWWFIRMLPDRPKDYTVWSMLEPARADSRTWAGVIQVGSATSPLFSSPIDGHLQQFYLSLCSQFSFLFTEQSKSEQGMQPQVPRHPCTPTCSFPPSVSLTQAQQQHNDDDDPTSGDPVVSLATTTSSCSRWSSPSLVIPTPPIACWMTTTLTRSCSRTSSPSHLQPGRLAARWNQVATFLAENLFDDMPRPCCCPALPFLTS